MPKIILVTGANSGIGRAAIQAVWQSGHPDTPYHILAAGRSIDKVRQTCNEITTRTAQPANSSTVLEPLQLDISSDESVHAAVQHIRSNFARLDALVNNAGGSFDFDIEAGTMTEREAWSKTMDLGAVAPQCVTSAFAELLVQSPDPRLLFVTSGMSSLVEEHGKCTSGERLQPTYTAGWPKPQRTLAGNAYAYRASKSALNMVFLLWNRILEPDGVKCFAVSPGFLATNLAGDPEKMRQAGAGDPMLGGKFILDILEGKRDTDAGKVIKRDGVIQPW